MSNNLPIPQVGRFSFVLFPSEVDHLNFNIIRQIFNALSKEDFVDAKNENNIVSLRHVSKTGHVFECVGSKTQNFGQKPVTQLELIWYVNEDAPDWSELYPPVLGAYAPGFVDNYLDVLKKWPADLSWRFDRAAVTISFVYPVDSLGDGANLVCRLLTNINKLPGDVNDFLYQANFPFKMPFKDKEMEMVRIGRWGGRTFTLPRHVEHEVVGNVTLHNVTFESTPKTTVLAYLQLGTHQKDKLNLSITDACNIFVQNCPKLDEFVKKGDDLS